MPEPLIERPVHPLATPLTDGQRRRANALFGFCLALAAMGALGRLPRSGRPPTPCDAPALDDAGVLRCDGRGTYAGARVWLVGQKLDLNRARRAEIESLVGIGPALTARILEARAARGGFSSMAELDEVRGVGPKTLARLSRALEVPAPQVAAP